MKDVHGTGKNFSLINILNVLRYIPAPVILACSFYLSSQSVIEYPPGLNVSDKLIHAFCFAGLAGASSWYWPADSWKSHFWRNVLICIAAVSIYGALDEFHQSFTPLREVSFLDWVADCAGAIIGSFAGALSVFLWVRFCP